jgi:hypothetical protein
LYKHRINIPAAGTSAAAAAAFAIATSSAVPLMSAVAAALCIPSAFSRHSACTRLASELLAAAHSHQQFRFVVRSAQTFDRCARLDPLQAQVAALHPFELALTLLNWNTSIRSSSAEAEETAVGLVPKDVKTQESLQERRRKDPYVAATGWWLPDEDTPVLKLRYVDTASAPPSAVDAWIAEGSFQTVTLEPDEVAYVLASLTSCACLIPQSVRTLSCTTVSYLPS